MAQTCKDVHTATCNSPAMELSVLLNKMPPNGEIVQFLSVGSVTANPSGTFSFSVKVSLIRKSSSTMHTMAKGTPEFPSAFLIVRPRYLLFLKIRRKYAMKKVPNMRIAESSAVFGSLVWSSESCKVMVFSRTDWQSVSLPHNSFKLMIKLYTVELQWVVWDCSGFFSKILINLLIASKMKRSETRALNISFVNLVKNLTSVDPWRAATMRAMMVVQNPIQTRQGR